MRDARTLFPLDPLVLAQQYSPSAPQRRTIVFESDDDAQPAVMSADLPAGSYLLDVREDDEWAAGHAPDATHVRLSELSARTGEIPREIGRAHV